MLSVYKASAGSGKTFTLAYEYIKLVLGIKDPDTGRYSLNKTGHERHRPILAITFTNKATDEMKRRIIHELAVLAGMETANGAKSPYADRLTELFGCSTEELAQCAHNALHELLFDFSFFNISTIDAFFQNILRIFAREAELTGNYEVELDDKYAISVGVNDMLSSINHNTEGNREKYLSEWLKQFMINRLDEGKSFNMFNRSSQFHDDLVTFAGNLSNEKFKLHADDLLEYLDDNRRISDFDAELRRRSENMLTTCQEKALRALNLLPLNGLPTDKYINRHVMSMLRNWAEGKPLPLNATCVKAMDCIDNRYYKDAIKRNTVVPEVDNAVTDALSSVYTSYPLITFYALTRKQLYVLGMLGDIFRYITAFRNDNNLILLSDTNDLLRRIISQDDAPFIYERIGMRLRHFLIDEFQDTSKLQWENLRPLVAESLSTDNDNLIIGDEKQCIYRFRNSDPSLLHNHLSRQFPDNIREQGNDISGNTNWRSSSDVVRFNNTIFTAIAEKLSLTGIYGNVVQQISPTHKDHRGYVKATCLDAPTVEEYDTMTLPLMAAEIHRQLDAGYKASEIAILVRQRNEGEKVIDFLLNYPESDPDFPHLNIISDDALGIANSPAVKLIISVMRFIDTPDDDNRPSSRHMTQREITRLLNRYEYFMSRDCTPTEALDKALKPGAVTDGLADEAARMECVSLPSIVERIITRYIPNTSLKRENAFISAFQDTVIDFCSRGMSDLHSFLKWWDTSGYKTCLSSPPDMEAIKVMTIHKSKGLEFKCVHIPYATWTMAKDKDIHWFTPTGFETFPDGIVPPVIPMQSSMSLIGTPLEQEYIANHNEEISDTLNLTYVAFTRAIDELIVNYQCTEKTNETSKTPIGYYIKHATETVTGDYCNAKIAGLGDSLTQENWDILVPLKECSTGGVTEIGRPTTPVRTGNREEKNGIISREIIPYYTADRDDMWNMSHIEEVKDLDRPRDRGIILHDILGQVRHRNDIPAAVRRHAYRLNITDAEADAITRQLQDATAKEDAAQWFEGYRRIIREQPIVLPTGEIYRPDRVVWTSAGTVDVIDYKFGEEHPEKYACQVRRYMRLIEEAGYSPARGFIWYVDSGKIVHVESEPNK
ncbi:MAG: UvrD-helicase domain-containing protein [Muribaculaceae bacterium]|nr:UvrD-helicase domain-containing protein [Muribaculaceae bacterium]